MYIIQIQYTEAILSNSTRKQLWFEITKMQIVVFIVLFIIISAHFRSLYTGDSDVILFHI